MKLTFIAAISAVCLLGPVRAARAASHYGPPPPPPSAPPPGGFSEVVTSRTITPAGGVIGPVIIDGATVRLVIPAGAFPAPVQITITEPNLRAFDGAGPAGYKLVVGVGIQVQENGSDYPGAFLKPLTLTIRSFSIRSSSIVVVWNGAAFVPVNDATVSWGVAVVTFDSDPDFAVLSPTRTGAAPVPHAKKAAAPATDANEAAAPIRDANTARDAKKTAAPVRDANKAAAPIPDATKSVTGKPFIGEGILACALVVLGASGITVGCRKRTRP
jgi:hypothetical protein